MAWLNQVEDILTYTSGNVCDENSSKCSLTIVLDFTCEKSGAADVLTVNMSLEEDIRLCRIANGDMFMKTKMTAKMKTKLRCRLMMIT